MKIESNAVEQMLNALETQWRNAQRTPITPFERGVLTLQIEAVSKVRRWFRALVSEEMKELEACCGFCHEPLEGGPHG